MDFNLTDSQQSYLDTVKRFVKNEIMPNVMSWEREHYFPMDIIRKAWELGILNLSIPASVKGFEIDVISTALIIMELEC